MTSSHESMFAAKGAHVPGALRAYRCWTLKTGIQKSQIPRNAPDGWEGSVELATYELGSTGVNGIWPTDGKLDAVCAKIYDACDCKNCGPRNWGRLLAHTVNMHQAPVQSCACGIYAWYRPEDTDQNLGEVVGAIEVSGRVLMGTHGVRAARAKVLAVAPMDGTQERGRLATLLGPRPYPIFDSPEQMLLEFPPDDTSGLIAEHTCEENCYAHGQQKLRNRPTTQIKVPYHGAVGFDMSRLFGSFFSADLTGERVLTIADHRGNQLYEAVAPADHRLQMLPQLPDPLDPYYPQYEPVLGFSSHKES